MWSNPSIERTLPWPPRLTALTKSHPVAVHYSVTVMLYFMPLFLVSLAFELALFRLVSHRPIALLATLVPHALLAWLLGGWVALLQPANAFLFGLTAISLGAIPGGLVLAWWLSRRRPLTLAGGHPPAGFAA
jgi:hypothetical protein